MGLATGLYSRLRERGGRVRLAQPTVRADLDARWSAWFDGLELTHATVGETTITRPVVDEAALHGLLARIRYRAGRGAYDFALPLFRDYIRRRAKLTELTRSVRSEPRPALAHSNSSGR